MASVESREPAIYVIDASSFIFRAYYALAPMSSRGRPSHALVGFVNTLFRLFRDKRPSHCVVVFDSKAPSFRKQIYSEYKANRTTPPPDLSEQIEAVRCFCEAANLPILQGEGFEADDWIASFVRQYVGPEKLVVVSTDKDLMTLVGDGVSLYDAFKDKTIRAEDVLNKWGVNPNQISDYLSLTGDSSDNIPGVAGIGSKTAAQLLGEYGSIEKLLSAIAALSPQIRKKIEASRDNLELSRKLVALKDDLELPFASPVPLRLPLPPRVGQFLREWDCHRILEQFAMEIGDGVDLLKVDLTAEATVVHRLATKEEDLHLITKGINDAGAFAFDLESDSFDRFAARLVGVSIAWNLSESWYIPVRHREAPFSENRALEFLRGILANPQTIKIAHNLKYDSEVLDHDGLGLSGAFEDTMLQAYMLFPDRRSFSLASLSETFLGKKKCDLEKLLESVSHFGELDLERAVEYAALDAHLTFALYSIFRDKISSDQRVARIYYTMELPLIEVLRRMEGVGIWVDADLLKKISLNFHQMADDVRQKIFDIAGGEFNIQSPKQLQEVLFGRLRLTPTKKTKTGFSTDESVLEELGASHELPQLILRFRSLTKLTSTYVDVLPKLIGKVDGRIHTSYHQTGTATGRLSSSEPNLQNIPVRSPEGLMIRRAFRARIGSTLLSADYSQVELRLFAHMASDERLIAAFRSGRDIHGETAKLVFGDGGDELRERAKAINYGIVYGISAFGLAKQLRISRSEAAAFIDSYFNSFPMLRGFMEELVSRTRKNGYSETLFGRRRPLPDIHSSNPSLRQLAERMAINAPVQGTAADIMKAAMVRIHSRILGDGVNARLLLQVHDELVLEVEVNDLEKTSQLVSFEMARTDEIPGGGLAVPLVVSMSHGDNWADMHGFE